MSKPTVDKRVTETPDNQKTLTNEQLKIKLKDYVNQINTRIQNKALFGEESDITQNEKIQFVIYQYLVEKDNRDDHIETLKKLIPDVAEKIQIIKTLSFQLVFLIAHAKNSQIAESKFNTRVDNIVALVKGEIAEEKPENSQKPDTPEVVKLKQSIAAAESGFGIGAPAKAIPEPEGNCGCDNSCNIM